MYRVLTPFLFGVLAVASQARPAAYPQAADIGKRIFLDPSLSASGRLSCASCHDPRHGYAAANDREVQLGGRDLSRPGTRSVPSLRYTLRRTPIWSKEADFFDLGLCGPQRTDQVTARQYCGMFKTPSLRNVAARQVFFHNGIFHDLRDVIRFYATRDHDPDRWYAQRGPDAGRYDDLPAALQANVDHIDAPFNRGVVDSPALTEAEIDDLLAFLETLTDRDNIYSK